MLEYESVIKMVDRETISRTIINILDIHRYYEYDIFSHQDMYEKILEYGCQVVDNDNDAVQFLKNALEKHHDTIDLIANDKEVTIQQFSSFTESLRAFRKKYIQKKQG